MHFVNHVSMCMPLWYVIVFVYASMVRDSVCMCIVRDSVCMPLRYVIACMPLWYVIACACLCGT